MRSCLLSPIVFLRSDGHLALFFGSTRLVPVRPLLWKAEARVRHGQPSPQLTVKSYRGLRPEPPDSLSRHCTTFGIDASGTNASIHVLPCWGQEIRFSHRSKGSVAELFFGSEHATKGLGSEFLS